MPVVLLKPPKRTPKAEGGGASAGKVAAALAPPAAAVAASQSTVAISSPSKSPPSKQLNLDSLDIKVTNKDVVQKYKSAKEARGGGASGYKLTVNLSGVVTTSGRAKVVGVVNLVGRRNAPPYWTLKPA